MPYLSLMIWLPIVGGLWLLYAGGRKTRETALRHALAVSAATFLLSLPLYSGFVTGTHEMQFQERWTWIPAFDIYYHLGVDGIAMPLVLLTTFSTLLVVLAAWGSVHQKTAQYLAAFLLLEGSMNGVFTAMDAILFYVFWEAMLIPMFLIIGIWGGERRIYATVKFFLYTFLGSVFMLVALLYLYARSGSFSILAMQALPLGLEVQKLVFIAFLLAFAVKIPMWPVHTWLPDAHVEAPTGGSVILAAIMLKMGGYGFLRFSLPIAPAGSETFSGLMIALSLIAIVYIGFVALVQQDMKRLIAYSSISHMGFVTLGFFIAFALVANPVLTKSAAMGLEGGIMQMLSHGFVSGAMFLCVGVLYDRLHSRQIGDYGGVVNTMPVFASLMMLFAMANAGLPGTSGFVGELLVILSAYQANFWFALLAGSTLILGAAYTLWMYKRVIFGEVANQKVAALKDLDQRERLVLGSLAAAVVLFGVWPAPVFDVMHASVDHLVEQLSQPKLP
ncbi:MAG: NADH-quinone oxidoreductase subunit M [Gammaproteobacteria bacterium]